MESHKIGTFLKSLSILLPLLVGLIRYNKIDVAYKPFILYLVVGTVTEIISFVTILVYKSNAISSNIFILAEWLLVSWQFYCWGVFSKRKKGFFLLVLGVALMWFIENVFCGKLLSFSPYFRVVYAFCIVLMSVSIINYTIINDFKNIFSNARFLICLAFIISFIYKMISEWAYQVSAIKRYESLSNLIIAWLGNVNVLVNLIFVVALLLFPTRNKFNLK